MKVVILLVLVISYLYAALPCVEHSYKYPHPLLSDGQSVIVYSPTGTPTLCGPIKQLAFDCTAHRDDSIENVGKFTSTAKFENGHTVCNFTFHTDASQRQSIGWDYLSAWYYST